jgi:membrane-bound lytic murein transglycosylase A
MSRFLRAQATTYAVVAFVGFSLGLLVAALFFPTRVERVEVIRPDPTPIETPDSDTKPLTLPEVTYTEVAIDTLPGWADDRVSEGLPALRNACAAFDNTAETKSVGPDGLGGTVADWRSPCAALARVQSDDDDGLRAFLSEFFVAYAVSSPDSDLGKFTGYYETSLRGSLTRTETFSVPLYAKPTDLVELDKQAFDLPTTAPDVIGRVENRRLVPYDARRAIEQDAGFSNRAEVLVWVDDLVDAHLLHIQGSGRVCLTDGTERRIGYAGNNGRRFRGIGGILLSAGVLGPGQGSMPAVADWLRSNPIDGQRYMEENPRFIFFRWNDGPGPIGAFGVPLEPLRSLAVDPRYIPYGAPLWLNVKDPDGEPLDRLVVALDTGSAIRGVVRGDFFWGAGDAAFAKAGRMNSAGRYHVFLPRSVAAPSQKVEKPL